MNNMDIKAAENENDYLKCWKVIKELRPHLTESEYLSMMNEMKSEGYRLAYIEDGGIAASAIGFRYLQFMFNGKHFYIDDLCHPARTPRERLRRKTARVCF
jgi:hypothetical protein